LELNGRYQLVVCTHYVDLLGVNVDIIKKNTEALLGARKKVDLEVNAE
jgi:hypothetical protein